MNIIGKGLQPAEFEAHLAALKFTAWQPSLVCIHHTASPTLAQRPKGWQSEHMANLKWFYEHEAVGAPWSAGPHIFTDEDQAWLFTPLTQRGLHARSFNATAIGIEMLGDYDGEDPWSGRGLQVLNTTARITALLLQKLQAKDELMTDVLGRIRFHRDDPKTSKTCPGRKIEKEKFVKLVIERWAT